MSKTLTRVKATRDFRVGSHHELIISEGSEFDVELLSNNRFFINLPRGTFGECVIGNGWIIL